MPCRPTNRSACWALGALTTLDLSDGGTALAGGSIPARSGWYQMPRTQLERVCTRQPEVQGVMGCRGITEGWSSAVFDTKRNRLVIWGGGHSDYYGNELYSLEPDTLRVARITEPGLPVSSPNDCQEAIAGGTQPNSRHTYDGIAYVDSTDSMFAPVAGGS